MIKGINMRDLKAISRSTSVPSVPKGAAKRLLSTAPVTR